MLISHTPDCIGPTEMPTSFEQLLLAVVQIKAALLIITAEALHAQAV